MYSINCYISLFEGSWRFAVFASSICVCFPCHYFALNHFQGPAKSILFFQLCVEKAVCWLKNCFLFDKALSVDFLVAFGWWKIAFCALTRKFLIQWKKYSSFAFMIHFLWKVLDIIFISFLGSLQVLNFILK